MWGRSIVGLGSYHYRYERGHEGTAPLVSFAPCKENLVVYLIGGVEDLYPRLLERLRPHEAGKGCLYLKRLGDVDHEALRELVERTVRPAQQLDAAPPVLRRPSGRPGSATRRQRPKFAHPGDTRGDTDVSREGVGRGPLGFGRQGVESTRIWL
jgi:hypothetical protein